MTAGARSLLTMLGSLCLVLAVMVVAAAIAMAVRERPLYASATLFKTQSISVNEPQVREAFQKAQAKFPEKMKRPLTARVTLEMRVAPDFFRLEAMDANPGTSAETANTLTMLMREALLAPGSEAGDLMLLEMAQPAEGPTKPNVKLMVGRGMALGGACAVVGALMLAAARRKPGEESQPVV